MFERTGTDSGYVAYVVEKQICIPEKKQIPDHSDEYSSHIQAPDKQEILVSRED